MALQSLGALTVDLIANTAGFERGMNQAERALASTTKEAKYQGDQLERLIGKIDPTVAAYARLDKMEQQLEAHRKAGRLPTEDYVEYIAKINASREAIGKADSVIARSGVSAKQTAAAFGMLPAQLSDIAVQLAGGQNPFLILLQQGSQIKDSFGGIGPTFDAFGAKIKGLFTGGSGLSELAAGAMAVGDSAEAAGEGLGSMAEGANTAADASKNAAEAAGALKTATEGASLSVGAIVGIAVAAAAAIAALVIAYKQGSDEATAYNTALVLTGNTAGTTSGQLAELAKEVSASNGTVREAAKTLALLAGSTRIPVSAFKEIAIAASNLEDATGKAASETVADFAKIAEDPVKAVLKLNESLNFLTTTVYGQIKALQESGRIQEAATLATDTYAEAVNTRSAEIAENLGYVEGAWKKVADTAKAAWDAFLDVGREKTLDEKLAELDESLRKISENQRISISDGFGNLTPKDDFRSTALEAERTQLLIEKSEKERRAASRGLAQQAQRDALADQLQLDKLRTETQSKEERRTKELAAYQELVSRRRVQAEKLGNKELLISAEQQAKDIANIENKYKDPVTPKGPAYSEDAGMKMLDSLRQQNAALQLQSETNDKLGVQAKALAAFEQQIADIKTKSVLTADQKSLLASEDLITAQLKRNVALEQEVAARKKAFEEAGKLAAFELNQQSKLAEAREANNARLEGLGQGTKLRERLQEELAIRKEYQNEQDKLEAQRSKDQISPERYETETTILKEALAERLVDQQDYYNQVDEASGSFFTGASEAWANWATEAQDYSAQASEFVKGSLDALSGGLADTFMSILDGTKSVGEAFADLGATMVREIVGALVKMAAQWLVYQAVQLLVGTTSSAASIAQAAVTGTAIATAYAPAAALASLASFGANAIPATGAILSTTAIAEGVALAGMAHDGIDSIPETGTWLLQKGERVTTAQTSAKLDKTLNDIKSPTGGGNTTVNLIEDASRAGQTETREENGQKFIDLWIAKLYSDDDVMTALNRKTGLTAVGQ